MSLDEYKVNVWRFQVDLRNAIDMHIHSYPDVFPRLQHYVDIAKDARKEEMRGIVLKPMGSFPTMDRARAAEEAVLGIKVFGGIVLDYSVGGLNTKAVSTAIKMGAKVVWMPLFDTQFIKRAEAYQKMGYLKPEEKGITILMGSEDLVPEIGEICDIIAEAKDVILATSHLSPEEIIALINEAKNRGVENVIATHVNARVIGATLEQQKEMARSGAYIELSAAQHLSGAYIPQDPREVVRTIKTVGPNSCIVSSDAGNVFNDPATILLRRFITQLMAYGITESEIDVMVRENPSKILGI